MFVSRFDTRFSDRYARYGLVLAMSLGLHLAGALGLAYLHPAHPFPKTAHPIPVRLLRVDAAAEPKTPIAVPAPSPPPAAQPLRPPPKTPASPPKAPDPERLPKPALPLANPTAARMSSASPESASLPEDTAPSEPPSEGRDSTPTDRGSAAPYTEAEVDRVATPATQLRPAYPRREQRRGRESSVLLRLTVSSTGVVGEIDVVESGGSAFDAAALAALREARFRPALREGRAVPSTLLYRMRFALR